MKGINTKKGASFGSASGSNEQKVDLKNKRPMSERGKAGVFFC